MEADIWVSIKHISDRAISVVEHHLVPLIPLSLSRLVLNFVILFLWIILHLDLIVWDVKQIFLVNLLLGLPY